MSLKGEQQPTANLTSAPTGSRYFKLSDLWTASTAAWFGIAEAQFLLRNINSQQERFALVAAVLPEASARCVAHLLANPGDTSYTDLKGALLSAHQLTSFQKAERLFSSDPPWVTSALQSFYWSCWNGSTTATRGRDYSPCCFCTACQQLSGCSSRRTTTKTSGPWRRKQTGVRLPSTATSSRSHPRTACHLWLSPSPLSILFWT